ncbi:MAG: hypothetical protein H7A37_02525 [Chlamydiales bacterium]|nr:hypothetical protein [Chlamydiia bacterium]MCP5507164.1 hypothetical protein [Chlamydiales bacterium]
MNHLLKFYVFLSCLAVLFVNPCLLEGTNGAYLIGYGAKSKGMGGVSIALPQETLVALTNPAGMVFLGNRYDIGAGYIYSQYWETIKNNSFGKDGHADLNTFRNVPYIEAGYNRMLSPRCSVGVTGAPLAGGIIFHRKRDSDTPGEGPHKLTVAYPAISPCAAMKIGDNQGVGISLDLVAALLNVQGFQSIVNRDGSAYPDKVTNNGWDFAPGFGVRIGWMMHVTPCFSVGLGYRSQTFMASFDKYKGLLTPKGRANLPQSVDFGVSFYPSASTVVA